MLKQCKVGKKPFQQMCQSNWEKKNLNVSLTPYKKFNSKGITDLNIKYRTIKL